MKNAIISAEKLNLIFETADDDVVALKDVSLNIDKGEFVSFIGPSGCGKTTFLRAIASLEKPSSGNLSVNGLSPEEARKKKSIRIRLSSSWIISLEKYIQECQFATRNNGV